MTRRDAAPAGVFTVTPDEPVREPGEALPTTTGPATRSHSPGGCGRVCTSRVPTCVVPLLEPCVAAGASRRSSGAESSHTLSRPLMVSPRPGRCR
jgi:hypothetical protein